MVRKLTVTEQRKLMRSLPATRMKAVRDTCHVCEMHGQGVKETLKKVKKVLGDLGREFGPVILRELVLPLLKAKLLQGKGLKLAGQGLHLAGGRRGAGLSLAGGRRGAGLSRGRKVRKKN